MYNYLQFTNLKLSAIFAMIPFVDKHLRSDQWTVVNSLQSSQRMNSLVPKCDIAKYTWWLIPLSKWVTTLVINGISGGNVHLYLGWTNPLTIRGMSHQVPSNHHCMVDYCWSFDDILSLTVMSHPALNFTSPRSQTRLENPRTKWRFHSLMFIIELYIPEASRSNVWVPEGTLW